MTVSYAIEQYQLAPRPPKVVYDPAPESLQPGQPIIVHAFITYSEWSQDKYIGRFPVCDRETDVLVGKQQERFRYWYIKAYSGFCVSNTAVQDVPCEYSIVPFAEIIRFVSKEVIE